jgi:sterol desaturase/sphingolipid hydroxylase (fatty acid hydroxylase superfamily)
MLGAVADQQPDLLPAVDLRGFWRERHCPLDRMTLRQVLAVYVRHPAVWAYVGLLAASVVLVGLLRPLSPGTSPLGLAGAAALAFLLYPAIEYLLHRFLLHARFLYRMPLTVDLWRRIHYDHHSDPDNLQVLFGALPTTLPTIVVATVPPGLLIAGPAGAVVSFAAGLVSILVYEFCHTVDHLPYAPRTPLLRRIKRLHLLHHLHNERGNFGITSFLVDRILGTYYGRASEVPRSATAFDLGYTGAERIRYPWLAQRSEPGDAGR